MNTLKIGYLVLEGVNSFATVYYSFYLYFFMHTVHGFDNRANLALAALNGFVYMLAVWWAGRFAQRRGYFTALKLGFTIMALALAAGSQVTSATAHVLVMVATLLGMSFTWPTLEALVSEGETSAGLQRMLGLYNVIWAAAGAVAYFIGGALLEELGLNSLFYFPCALMVGQLGLTLWLEAHSRRSAPAGLTASAEISAAVPEANPRPIAKTRVFLRLAWWANPFAYIASNTIIAVIPGIAARLHLSTMFAGFCCSVWCFARLGAFVGLWQWSGWHYRFRWLLAGYLMLVAAFAAILLVPSLVVLVLAQIAFGTAVGLLYYSSLYYSMHRSETKGAHGGIHEAAIGLGNCVGPAVGAASLSLWPQQAGSSALAVSALLLLGLGGLLAVWKRG